ncbi:MAG TPA: helix-turn-helix domain-containing protein [Woeseiaceae bacterium]|nr:helix-turn-helix domain-containing protein [Woeseiaceae bacterium]
MFLTEDKERSGSSDTLGGRIVNAREAQQLTTSQLARRMGIEAATLNDWETDRAEPQSNRLLALAGILDVSPAWLLTGAGEDPFDSFSEAEMMQIRDSVDSLREQVLTIADELEQLQRRLELFESRQS